MKIALSLLAVVVFICGCVALAVDPPQGAIFTHKGIHPAVAAWYHRLHPNAFSCKDDPYECASCPVGAHDRVITIPEEAIPYKVPREVNAYFLCNDINRLVPDTNGWSDIFICKRFPQDGSIVLHGLKISCAAIPEGTRIHLGDLAPGESGTITIPAH